MSMSQICFKLIPPGNSVDGIMANVPFFSPPSPLALRIRLLGPSPAFSTFSQSSLRPRGGVRFEGKGGAAEMMEKIIY